VWLLPLVAVVLVAGLMLATGHLLSAFGWGRLARHYRAAVPPDGTHFRFCHAQIGRLNYSGGLTLVVGPEGLGLSIPWWFMLGGHPPLFLPWADVTATPGRSFWAGEHLELRTSLVPGTPIRLPRRLGERIAAAAGRAWAGGTE
jgi:hypothetical protein